jgi:hypothetical protein
MTSCGPSGSSGQPGFTVNPWSSSGVSIDARIQACISGDRNSVYYSWTETDTTLTGNHWNTSPNIKMRGFNLPIGRWTNPVNVTAGIVNADKSAYFHFMSDRSILTNTITGTNEIPFTISNNATQNGNSQIIHYYIKGASFKQSDFNYITTIQEINPLNNNLSINCFPNPARNYINLYVNLPKDSHVEVILLSSNGQELEKTFFSGTKGENILEFDVTGRSPGLYLFRIRAENSEIFKKIIVQ